METALKTKPDWAGDDWLSRLVNLLIKTPPLYALMKSQARAVLIRTAEKSGVPWRQACAELEASGVKDLLETVTNPAVVYPDYYQVPFHAYPEGNLCWQAAFEAEAATYAMGIRIWPREGLTWSVAQARLRGGFHEVLDCHGPAQVTSFLDIGCSVGISTLTLLEFYQRRQNQPIQAVGLDLSPYMLAVAQWRDTQGQVTQWVHAPGEATGLDPEQFDLVTLQLVLHELPRQATQAIFREAWRVLKPGGCLALWDNDPSSAVMQNLPPVLFTLMKSTEPWTDDYYTFDLETALRDMGWTGIVRAVSDPRHRTILAYKPDHG